MERDNLVPKLPEAAIAAGSGYAMLPSKLDT